MCVCVCVCVCSVSVSVSVCVSVCVRACVSLHCLNEIVTLLNLTVFLYNFHTWLKAMFYVFVSALCEWNVTKTYSCVHLNVTGE